MGFFPNTANQGVAGNLSVTGSATVTGGPLTVSAGGASITGGITAPAGNVDVSTAGNGLRVAEGANAKQGTATLTAGTVVVADTSVTANSRILLSGQSLGTVTTFSAYGVSARTPGTSFTILASQATDTSVVAYEIFEPG